MATSRGSGFTFLGLCVLTLGACSSTKGGGGGTSGTGGATGSGGMATGGGSGGIGGGGGAAPDAGVTTDAGPQSCGDPVGPTANESVDPSGCTNKVACAPGLLCGGLNCDTTWICFSHDDDDLLKHPCPGDMAEYCGCDGVTFEAFNTCPDRPFEHWGACGDGVNCNPEDLRCALTEPTCPEGMIASVVKGSYGPCVPLSQCRCEFGWQCPHGDKYTCDATAHRCGPKPSPDAGRDASDQNDAAPRFSGVDPSKRLDGLTPDEQKTVCDYKASYYGGYGMTVQCGLGFVLIGEDSQEACLAAWPTVCAVSVAQLELCFNERTCAHPTPASCDALLPCHN